MSLANLDDRQCDDACTAGIHHRPANRLSRRLCRAKVVLKVPGALLLMATVVSMETRDC